MILVFLFLTNILHFLHSCPDDTWVAGDEPDTCYHVSLMDMSWHAAQEYCELLGGYLAEINTSQEQKFLETILRS